MDIQKKIDLLKDIILNEINERTLIDSANHQLTELRYLWRADNELFSDKDITLLKRLSQQVKVVQQFVDEMEEFEYVLSKEDADEIIGNLYLTVDGISELAVSKRVAKEIRELIQKKQTLPSRVTRNSINELSTAISSLQANAPLCKKCGSTMILREGNGDYFWGCSMFPDCWSRRKLSKDERSKLPD